MTHDAASFAASGSDHATTTVPAPLVTARHPALSVWGLAIGCAVAAIACMWASPDVVVLDEPFGSWTLAVVVVMFGVAELSVINVHFKRETMSFALNEIPIAFAVVFLGTVSGPLSRIPMTVLVLAVVRGNRGHKLVFNIAVHVFEVAFAGFVYRLMLDAWGTSSVMIVLAAAVALIATIPVTLAAIATAIGRYEGNTIERILGEYRATWWLVLFNSVLAAMTVALALFEPVLTVLSILPVMGLWYVLHAYGTVSQDLRDLNALHGFAGRVGDTLDVAAIGDLAVDEAMQMFRGSGAALARFGPGDPVIHAVGSLSVSPNSSNIAKAWLAQIESGDVELMERGNLDRLGLQAESPIVICTTTPVTDGGEVLAVLVVARDDLVHEQFEASDRARLQNIARQLSVSLRRGMLHARMEWEARHDALTELPARTLFERTVDDLTAEPPNGSWYVMMLDLDRFKEVNDTLGHHAGDELLIEFSRRTKALLGPDDTLARLAGDEFAILCRRDDPADIDDLARRCGIEGGRPVTLDGLEIVVTVSVGVAQVLPTDREAIQPMRRADIAMYNAKWQRTGVEFYRDEIDRRTPARLSMLGDLRTAIETDQLTVVYQPKLDIATGSVHGVEALVRWVHPERGNVPPTEFVRVAEDTGLIKQLTDLVLAQGIAMLATFQREGLPVGLAVNLSTHDLFDARLPERVEGYLRSNGVSPSMLTLEITESSLFVDAPRTRATIADLSAVGLHMAVDDFGTGYSSLSYLRQLPVNELKIDQSFVGGMLVDPQDEVIVRSTIDLGHNLGLKVVAEGVESFEILDRLREVGCDVAQGYAISQPVLADDIVGWLHRTGDRAWLSVLD